MNKSSDSDNARDEIIQAWIKCNGETNHSNKDKIVKFANYIIAEAQEEVKSCQEELRLCQQDAINIQSELAECRQDAERYRLARHKGNWSRHMELAFDKTPEAFDEACDSNEAFAARGKS